MNYGFTKQFSTENAARYFARVENRIEKWPTALEIHIGYIQDTYIWRKTRRRKN